MPALFTRMAGAPWWRATLSTKWRTLRVSLTSSTYPAMLFPARDNDSTAALHFGSVRQPITTNASAFINWRAISWPIPRLPPVTMAILFAGMGLYDTGMPKLLRAVRLDDSDDHVFRSSG